MSDNAADAVLERINCGGEVPTVNAALIENIWAVMSSMPPERRENCAIGLGAIAGGVPPESIPPDQTVALMVRFSTLEALIRRRLLDDYLKDDSLRKSLFAAVATISMHREDLAEAMADRIFREASPEVAQKTRDEMRDAGLDPDFPKIAGRLIRYVRESA